VAARSTSWTDNAAARSAVNGIRSAVQGSAERIFQTGASQLCKRSSAKSFGGAMMDVAEREVSHLGSQVGFSVGTAAGALFFKTPAASALGGEIGRTLGSLIAEGLAGLLRKDKK